MIKIGQVSEEEKQKLVMLYWTGSALMHLKNTLGRTDLSELEFKQLQKRLIPSINKNNTLYNNWFTDMKKKYKWNVTDKDNVTVDFESNEVFID